MSNCLIPSLEILPVEILHRVFDSLDAKTILTSIRGTCRRFQALVSSYDKFVLNFKQISKPDFQLICHLIDPQNVISLTLSHDDETLYAIELCTSRFDTKLFSRLRSLTLIEIEERHLKFLLKCVNINSLISFSLKIGKSDDRHRKTTATLLSSVIAHGNLRRFEFEIPSNRVESLTWPVQSMIQHLRISASMTFCPCIILQCSPVLQTLAINFPKNHQIVFTDTLLTSFRQVNSLTLENLSTKIETLELLLSLTPSLTHLKLIGTENFFDGNRWEQFIQANLPFLNKFEFFVQESKNISYTREDVESIIASFRTPFWLEHKKWFVTCQHNKHWPPSTQLYSIPVCVSSLIYQSESSKVSCSTCDAKPHNEPSIMDNIKTIQLDFARVTLNNIKNEAEEIRHPLFRKVEKLEFKFNFARVADWNSFTSMLIDLTTIVQIKLSCISIYQAEELMLAEITGLLQQTCNLSSLDLFFPYRFGISNLTAEDICLMTPSHVRHLAVPIKSLNEIKIVLERLEHLSSAKFSFQDKSSSRQFIKWLKENKNGSSYRIGDSFMCVWLGRKHIQPEEINIGAKRIKLTDDNQNS